MQFRKRETAAKPAGQALVEMALVLIILLFVVFVLVEAARLLFAYATVQHAVRVGARYGITGQYDENVPEGVDPRVHSIRTRVISSTLGLRVEPDYEADEAYYFMTEVAGADGSGGPLIEDYAGVARWPLMVRAEYRLPMITPLTRPIAENVLLRAEIVMNNEPFDQIVGSRLSGGASAPPIPAPTDSDLSVTKADSSDPVTVGQEFDYTIGVTNNGPRDASNVVVTDTLPLSVTYISSDPAGTCSHDSGVLTCTVGNVPNETTATFSVRVRPDVVGQITNRVDVTGDEYDPYLTDNTAQEGTVIEGLPGQADIQVTKTDGPDPVLIGSELTYTIVIHNDGPSTATNVVMTDQLPPSVTYDRHSTTIGTCSIDGQRFTCDLGDMADEETATIQIVVIPQSEGTLDNTAIASSPDVDDPQSNNDGSAAQTTVLAQPPEPEPDLAVTKSAPAAVTVGDSFSYSIQAINNSLSDDATGVSINDTLPGGITVESIVTSQGSCSQGGNVVTCNLGNLGAASSANVTINVTAPLTAGTIVNQVTIDGAEVDPNSLNNAASASTVVESAADLQVTKSGPQSITPGNAMTYQIIVTNDGPGLATGVSLLDDLPDFVSFVSASASQGTCSGDDSSVSCGLGTINAGGSVTVNITIIPTQTSAGNITNNVSVSSGVNDPDNSNNSDEATTSVSTSAAFITLNPVCGEPGTSVTVNGGNWPTGGPASERHVTLYWDPEGPDAQQTLTTINNVNSPSWSGTFQIPVNATDNTHTIRAVRRGIEASAQFTVPCPAPNLIIGQPTVISQTPVVVGEPVTFRATVRNVGNLDAVSQFFAGIYFDPLPAPALDSTHISSDYRQALVAVSGLAAGGSKVITFTVSAGFSTPGAHTVYAVADSDPAPSGVIDERRETDNISTPRNLNVAQAATPTPGPTPTATPTATPGATPVAGGIAGQVLNLAGLPQANAEVRVYLESSGSQVARTFSGVNGVYFVDNLAPGIYTATACIIIEENGELNDYYDVASGIEVLAGGVSQQDLVLEFAPGGCPGD